MKDRILKVRKHRRQDPLDDNRALMRFAQDASRAAIKQHLEKGVAVVYERNGYLVRETPDHEVTVIRQINKKPFDLRDYLCQG